MAALESGLDQLVKVSDSNSEVFQDALNHIDTMLGILRRVTNDMVAGTVVTGPDGVDLEYYHTQYNACIGVILFFSDLFERIEAEKPVLADTDDEVVIFGGNG